MHPIKSALFILCTLAMMSGAAGASSETGAVIVVGKAPAQTRAVAASAVRAAAQSVGWVLAKSPIADADVAKIVACVRGGTPWACVAPLIEARGIQRLIVVSLDPDRSPDGAPALALTQQILLQGAKATAADARFCPQCVDETLTRIAFDLTKQLIEEAEAGTAQTTITIKSIPPGAWITLDHHNVGLTDHTYSTFPGKHEVILQREGYETATRAVEVIKDRDTLVQVELRRRGGPITGSDRRYLVPGIIGGAGVAAVGTGIALQLAKDPPPLGEDQPKRLVSTPGIALIVGGTIAAGVGAYLWARASKRPRPHARSAPTAMITKNGGHIGWLGQF